MKLEVLESSMTTGYIWNFTPDLSSFPFILELLLATKGTGYVYVVLWQKFVKKIIGIHYFERNPTTNLRNVLSALSSSGSVVRHEIRRVKLSYTFLLHYRALTENKTGNLPTFGLNISIGPEIFNKFDFTQRTSHTMKLKVNYAVMSTRKLHQVRMNSDE